jgi:hypothetical protein
MCSKATADPADDPSGPILAITNAASADVTTAMAADWPVGDYDIKVSVKPLNGKTGVDLEFKFTVASCEDAGGDDFCGAAGADVCITAANKTGSEEVGTCRKDPNDTASHVVPAACTM